jgi:uncharacterized protein YjbI with pentapeptide repeats
MANAQLLEILSQGVSTWNRWTQEHVDIRPDLSGARLRDSMLREIDLSGADLSGADLSGADLTDADLHDSDLSSTSFHGATLIRTDLSRSFGPVVDFSHALLRNAVLGESKFAGMTCDGADLTGADCQWSLFPNASFVDVRLYRANVSHSYLAGADFSSAKLQGASFYQSNLSLAKFPDADLRGTHLVRADLAYADFTRADLRSAHLEQAILMETRLQGAKMAGSHVYGIAVWDVSGEPASQTGLIIRPPEREDSRGIIVDDLEIAQFIYLLTKHQKLRKMLTSVMDRGVLLLGPFEQGGLIRLEAIAERLRSPPFDYLPIIFDFDRPRDRTYTETVKTLVGLSRFVIVDLSGPSVPKELEATVPDFKVPFVPIIEKGRQHASMLVDIFENDWVLDPPVEFSSQQELLQDLLPNQIIPWAEARHKQRQARLDRLYHRA